MNKQFDWNDYLPSYFEDQLNYLTSYDKTNLLIVEGSKDKLFYQPIIANYHLKNPKTNKTQQFDLLKQFIYPNPFENNNTINSGCRFHNTYNESDVKIYAFDYVINAIKYFNNCNLDNLFAFGIIDKDMGHNFGDVKNLSMSYYHDIETTLIVLFLPSYLVKKNQIVSKDMITSLTKILLYCFKQGVLEYTSILFEKEHPENIEINEKIKRISHISFQKNMSKNQIEGLFYSSKNEFIFDIDNYLKNYPKYSGEVKSNTISLSEFQNAYNEFLKNYNENLEALNIESIDLEAIIKDWLNKKLIITEDDENKFNIIFQLINGHRLVEQIMLYSKKTHKRIITERSEEEFKNYIRDELILRDGNYDILFSNSPLMEFRDYQIDNELLK